MPPGSDVWHVQNSFKEVFNRDLLPRLEKICDELGFDHGVGLRLDKLTINTGSISTTELTNVWVAEVENAFREELISQKRARFSEEQIDSLNSNEQSGLSTFMYFLEKGVLPWWISDEFELTLEQLFQKLLTDQPGELVSRIQSVKNKTALVNRLLYQFEPKELRKLLKHFEQPKTQAGLSLIKSILTKGKQRLSEALEASFFFTEMVTSINPTLAGQDHKKLFELLFSQFREHSIDSGKIALLNTHKQLTHSIKELKKSKSLEDSEVISSAVHVVSSILSSIASEARITAEQSLSKEQRKSDQKGRENDTLSSTTINQKQQKNKFVEKGEPGASQVRTKEPLTDDGIERNTTDQTNAVQHPAPLSEGSGSTSGEQELLSDEDKRAWEHIERIKKQQLDKLAQGKENENSIGESGKAKVNQKDITEESDSLTPTDMSDTSGSSKVADSPTESTGPQNNKLSDNAETDDPTPPEAQTPVTEETLYAGNPSGSEEERPQHGRETGNAGKNAHRASDPKQLIPSQSIKPDTARPLRKPDQNSLKYWQEALESIDECYVQNAGLILLWPFLGQFLTAMGLVVDGEFRSEKDQKKATLLLQHLINPEPELDEYRLPLNKLMCGLHISEPVGKSINLSAEELEQCKHLLEATIHNWSALRGTSVEGFQSSFLLRKGVLKRHDSHWLLQVEKMPFDMLMDQLPWPISIVRLSWMNKPIYVEW